jgi:hypothetical protein
MANTPQTHQQPAAEPAKKHELPKPGDRDYVAGQPVDEEEARKTEEAEKARLEAGKKAAENHASKK